ncbi:hypothetical protein [Aeromonas sanarellii]|uniref:hypothetical protein n=1 Tax=Aeromonas TaxID=642 RepID=UPI002DB951D9|nr:hypothetical protein [Aeromonas sanarellii]MEB6606068.1 hypothetical protein [Aeromonas sanarellii]
MNRKLKSQGDLDGACFLYSIVNAVLSLNGEVTAKSWSNAISLLPKAKFFLRQDEGTLAFDDDGDKLENISKKFLHGLVGDQFKLEFHHVNKKGIHKLIDQHSVVIVSNPEHWFVVTEVYDEFVFIACSDVYNTHKCEYLEKNTPKYGHLSNSKIDYSALSVFGWMAFRITKES